MLDCGCVYGVAVLRDRDIQVVTRDDLTSLCSLSWRTSRQLFPFTPIDLGSLVAFDVRGWCHCQTWISPYRARIDDLAEAWVESELEHGCHSLAFIYGVAAVAAVALPFHAYFFVLMVWLQHSNIRRCHGIQLDRNSSGSTWASIHSLSWCVFVCPSQFELKMDEDVVTCHACHDAQSILST